MAPDCAWFKDSEEESLQILSTGWLQNRWCLLGPPLTTAGLTVLMGILPGLPFSPLGWAKLITSQEYGH